MNDYEIKPFMGHYILFVNGEEMCHCDTWREAMDEYENNYAWCTVV